MLPGPDGSTCDSTSRSLSMARAKRERSDGGEEEEEEEEEDGGASDVETSVSEVAVGAVLDSVAAEIVAFVAVCCESRWLAVALLVLGMVSCCASHSARSSAYCVQTQFSQPPSQHMPSSGSTGRCIGNCRDHDCAPPAAATAGGATGEGVAPLPVGLVLVVPRASVWLAACSASAAFFLARICASMRAKADIDDEYSSDELESGVSVGGGGEDDGVELEEEEGEEEVEVCVTAVVCSRQDRSEFHLIGRAHTVVARSDRLSRPVSHRWWCPCVMCIIRCMVGAGQRFRCCTGVRHPRAIVLATTRCIMSNEGRLNQHSGGEVCLARCVECVWSTVADSDRSGAAGPGRLS